MELNCRRSVAALTAAGILWGTTVPLSKVALGWLPPGWLTLARFGVAAVILLAVSRSGIRAAFKPAVLVSGAVGYGGAGGLPTPRTPPARGRPAGPPVWALSRPFCATP